MAAEPPDSMDEFFDFARLERDSTIYDASTQYGNAPDVMPSLGPDSAMDWQPTLPVDTGSFVITPALSNGLVQVPIPDLNPSDPMSSLMHHIPATPQVGATHNPTPSYSWQQRSMLQEDDIAMLKHESNKWPRPQTNSTVTRKPASAKRKGPSTRLPVEARQMLEEEFAANPYPCSWEMDIIAHQANLDVKRVRNWFNNTRARKKPESPGSCLFWSVEFY